MDVREDDCLGVVGEPEQSEGDGEHAGCWTGLEASA